MPDPGKTRVLLVDDDPELLGNLAEWLRRAGYEVHPAGDGNQALAQARKVRPDVAVTDLYMPGIGGAELVRLLLELDPLVQVIVLTGKPSVANAIDTLRHRGAFDFLTKPLADLSQLSSAIERAMVQRAKSAVSSAADPEIDLEAEPALTTRERELLELLATGAQNAEIASRLYLSGKTVRNQLTAIYDKLGVANRTQAVLAWQRARSG